MPKNKKSNKSHINLNNNEDEDENDDKDEDEDKDEDKKWDILGEKIEKKVIIEKDIIKKDNFPCSIIYKDKDKYGFRLIANEEEYAYYNKLYKIQDFYFEGDKFMKFNINDNKIRDKTITFNYSNNYIKIGKEPITFKIILKDSFNINTDEIKYNELEILEILKTNENNDSRTNFEVKYDYNDVTNIEINRYKNDKETLNLNAFIISGNNTDNSKLIENTKNIINKAVNHIINNEDYLKKQNDNLYELYKASKSKVKQMNVSNQIQISIQKIQDDFENQKNKTYSDYIVVEDRTTKSNSSSTNQIIEDIKEFTGGKNNYIFNVLYFIRDSYYIQMNERILCNNRDEEDKKKIYLKIPTIDLVTKALKQMQNNRLGYIKENKNKCYIVNKIDKINNLPILPRIEIDGVKEDDLTCFINEYEDIFKQYYVNDYETIFENIKKQVIGEFKDITDITDITDIKDIKDIKDVRIYKDIFLKTLAKKDIKKYYYYDSEEFKDIIKKIKEENQIKYINMAIEQINIIDIETTFHESNKILKEIIIDKNNIITKVIENLNKYEENIYKIYKKYNEVLKDDESKEDDELKEDDESIIISNAIKNHLRSVSNLIKQFWIKYRTIPRITIDESYKFDKTDSMEENDKKNIRIIKYFKLKHFISNYPIKIKEEEKEEKIVDFLRNNGCILINILKKYNKEVDGKYKYKNLEKYIFGMKSTNIQNYTIKDTNKLIIPIKDNKYIHKHIYINQQYQLRYETDKILPIQITGKEFIIYNESKSYKYTFELINKSRRRSKKS